MKTIEFKHFKYIGDPINTVKIFNEKEVDELAIFDIDATVQSNEPNYRLLEKIAKQSRMPLCYGGGIKRVDQALRIFNIGIEKIALSSAVLEDLNLVGNIIDKVGSQSVVIVIDVKKELFGSYEIYTHNGKKPTGLDPLKFVAKIQELGAGELIVNSIDNDGKMGGFDYHLIDKINENITIPLTILGGAGSMHDIAEAINRYKIIGVAAGSLFVFKGKQNAVLINYPSRLDRELLHKSI